MAKVKSFISPEWQPGPPKKTRQGSGKNTKHSPSSRNGPGKRYRGQGRG